MKGAISVVVGLGAACFVFYMMLEVAFSVAHGVVAAWKF